eukprot:Gb_21852 [translate_table: standard]
MAKVSSSSDDWGSSPSLHSSVVCHRSLRPWTTRTHLLCYHSWLHVSHPRMDFTATLHEIDHSADYLQVVYRPSNIVVKYWTVLHRRFCYTQLLRLLATAAHRFAISMVPTDLHEQSPLVRSQNHPLSRPSARYVANNSSSICGQFPDLV